MLRNNFVIGISALLGALMADRLFKYVVNQRLINGAPETTVGIFQIGYFTNTGIGLGIPLPAWLIVGMTLLIIISLVIWLIKRYGQIVPIVRWAIGLILMGAISNLYDRISYGHVIDTFNFWGWSIFNAADVWIVLGVYIIIIEMMAIRKPVVGVGINP